MDSAVETADQQENEHNKPDKVNAQATILLAGKCKVRETGNATTLHRLRSHIVSSERFCCIMIDPDEIEVEVPESRFEIQTEGNGTHKSPSGGDVTHKSLKQLIACQNVVGAIGIHLYRSASVFFKCQEMNIPYICFYGGTDINENIKDVEKLAVMTNVVSKACRHIALTEDLKTIALQTWPDLNPHHIKVIPSAIVVNPDRNFHINDYLEYVTNRTTENTSDNISNNEIQNTNSVCPKYTNKENDISKHDRKLDSIVDNYNIQAPTSCETSSYKCPGSLSSLFTSNKKEYFPSEHYPLLVIAAGLRPVKDVMYVADVWNKWHLEIGRKGKMVIIGPVLDKEYAHSVKAHAVSLSGVLVAGKLAPPQCQEAIRMASVFINTSISEGTPQAALEAMMLGTPVLARNNSGNSSVITHEVNGLLYNTPEEFLEQLQRLLSDATFYHTLIDNARAYVNQRHCAKKEQKAFLSVIQEVIS